MTSDELAVLREDVLARIASVMLVCRPRGVQLLQEVEAVVTRNDEALTEVAALQGIRPSEGLFNAMEAILLRYPSL